MSKKKDLRRPLAMAMAASMVLGSMPYHVMAAPPTGLVEKIGNEKQNQKMATAMLGQNREATTDALSSATYYRKANWENKIKDKSRWKVGDNQRLVRVTTSDPVEMNDIDYDGNFVDANGRTVLRMVYKEKGQAATAVWYRAIFNFGDLDQYIDYDKSYIVGLSVAGNEAKRGNLEPFNDRKERIVDLGVLRGDLTNQRKNLPINLVLKEGVTIDTLGKKNYIVQMRLADTKGEKIYAYAPKGTSMDYSTYTKTTSVSLQDKVNRLFIKGGYQSDNTSATNQEFVMSEFIANPEQYKDEKNLGIIRTQYMGQRDGNAASPTVGGKPIAFTQVFDANLLNYLKEDDDKNVAYVTVLEDTRLKSKFSQRFGIKKTDFNLSKDGKLAYVVIGPNAFQKEGIKKVEIPQHDQYTMLKGIYITAIDYVVDKGKFEDTFAGRDGGNATRKLNYSMISGWTNPNKDGWAIYEKTYDDGYVAHEGESFIIDTTKDPADGQIMIQIGNEDAIIRRQQGYYTYYVTGNKGIETIEKYADGIFKFDLREGATVKPGDKIKIFMPYTKDHKDPVNFLEIHNGTELNEGGATLKLQKDRNINMHLYKEGKKGYYILKYTLADGTKAEKKFEPKGFWSFDNKDKVMDGGSNLVTLSTGGNFYINTKKLKPGEDIIVESYDEKGTKLEDQTSWFKYRELTKAQDTVKELTWTDHSDKSSILSINKSLYTPYQVLFTNDYKDGTDDFYKDPRVLPASNDDFKKDTKEFVGYTKYDGGKVRTLYEEGKAGKLFAKVEAAEDEYDDKGNLKTDNSKKITIPKSDIFDAQFDGDKKEYRAYEYKVDLTKMLPYHSDNKTETQLTLLKDMKFVSTASDGSSLPSDLLETRVRARVLFDANTGKLADGKDKEVRIVPDNTKFYGEDGYVANGFEGANVEVNTGDKFPEAPTLAGKHFLGWVTEAGKTKLGDKAVVTADAFGKLTKDEIFTNETPVTKHLVVYAIYSEETAVTFDANEGKFAGDKDTTTVKVDNGSVAKPTDPTRDGYTFKGWAATKDATKADANILNNVDAPKTVYAVWEKTDKTPLELAAPTPVEVKDTKSLTSDEIDKVKKAVVEANNDKGITEADVTVAEDGTVTVTKDGKTGTLTPKQTVKQKEVQNNFNPPKEPVKVDKIGELKPEEIAAIKKAVKDANPERNFKDEEITVEADGTVKINQGGKVGTIPADKTVVQKDTILDLTAPTPVEVKDTTDLTQAERDKVAAAVKAKNSLPDTATIEVDSKGNVTVTDGTKTGKLEGKDTVKPFTRDGKTLNPPANKVKVGDTNKLTEQEKQQVRDEIKKANPDLGFTDDEIQVDDNGTVTVPITDSKNGTFEPSQTIEAATEADKTIKLVAPEKTPVQNLDQLTAEEKEKVKEAVRKANSTLPDTAKIEVAEDGSVVVTDGDKTGTLSQKDTVVDDASKLTLNKPRPVKVVDPQKLTPEEQKAVKDAVKAVNPTLTDDQITVDDKGNVTVTVTEGETTKTATLGPKDTIEKDENTDTTAPAAPKVEAKDDGSVTVTPPTDADTKEVEVTYVPTGKTEPVKVTATKDPETGKWSVPKGSDVTVDPDTGVITVPADKVEDGKEVSAVAKDKSGNASTPTETSKAKAKTPGEADTTAPAAPKVEAKDDGSVTVTPPTDADTKTVEVTYKDNDGNEKKVTATKDPETGKWTVPADSGLKVEDGKIVIPADKVKDGTEVSAVAKDETGNASKPTETSKATAKTPGEDKINAPAKPVEVKDPSNLTDEEKGKVEEAVKKANPDLPADAKVTVGNDGSVTVTDKDGKEIGKLKPEETVKGKTQRPERPEAGRGSWFFFGNGGFGGTSQGLVQKETKQVTERGRHEAYMYGYTDGTFRPDANITRSEAAAMIARLKGYDLSDKTAPKFSDTKVGWFKAAINAVFKNGLMKGYQDGSFRPNEKITRAEFAQMIKNIDQANGAVASFKDVKGHWAEAAINQAYGNGRIKGYPDGTFKPDAPITRAEAVTIANSLMGRSVDGRGLKEKLENPTRLSKFSDLTTSHWAFYEIMEATNSHDFERRDKGGKVEDWLEINKK